MKHLTSDQLLEKTKTLVSEERLVTLALIQHLEEIQRRMLYAELGYSSLWEFATQYLGLSEGAAQRRIQAMRLTRDVPEAKAAHAQLEASYAQLLELMANETLARLTKKNAIYDAHPATTAAAAVTMPSETEPESTLPSPSLSHARLRSKTQNTAPSSQEPPRIPPPGHRGYLPVAFRKALGARSQGRCEAVTRDGRRCGSRYRLQIDHLKPLALGGSNELANLQLVCAIHNRHRALAAGLLFK